MPLSEGDSCSGRLQGKDGQCTPVYMPGVEDHIPCHAARIAAIVQYLSLAAPPQLQTACCLTFLTGYWEP